MSAEDSAETAGGFESLARSFQAAGGGRDTRPVVVPDVVFENVSGNTFWFLFECGRRRRVPCSQVLSFVGKHNNRQAIQITAEAATELRRFRLID